MTRPNTIPVYRPTNTRVRYLSAGRTRIITRSAWATVGVTVGLLLGTLAVVMIVIVVAGVGYRWGVGR